MTKPALRKCEACGKEVSRHSLLCPHCGHPQGSRITLCLLGIFGLLLLALFAAFYCYCACLCD